MMSYWIMKLKGFEVFVKNEFNRNINFFKYGIIGIVGLGVEFFVFYVMVRIVGFHYLIANIFSVVTAITHNFLLNAFFNFKVVNNLFIRFLKYFSFGLTGLLISSGILYILVDHLLLNDLISKAIVLSFIVLVQYMLNKKFTFKM
jgi:putative flippase GtrA